MTKAWAPSCETEVLAFHQMPTFNSDAINAWPPNEETDGGRFDRQLIYYRLTIAPHNTTEHATARFPELIICPVAPSPAATISMPLARFEHVRVCVVSPKRPHTAVTWMFSLSARIVALPVLNVAWCIETTHEPPRPIHPCRIFPLMWDVL